MSISVSSRKRHSFQEGGSATFRGSSGGVAGQSRGVSPLNSQEMKDGGGSSGSNDSGSFAGSPQRYSISHFVSRVFYRLGLLCASQPRFVLILTFLVIVWSCFPLLSLPIYSTRPQIHQQPVKNFVRESKLGQYLPSGRTSPEQQQQKQQLNDDSIQSKQGKQLET